jgi:hypothetical protein
MKPSTRPENFQWHDGLFAAPGHSAQLQVERYCQLELHLGSRGNH